MNALRRVVPFVFALSVATAVAGVLLAQEATTKPFEPVVGQAGKDVVWVPTPEVLVEKMLDMARVTPQDFVMDLGSGDGRNIIAAAKRGAHGLGVEWNQDMVDLSRRRAQEAGVADKARFVQGDMYAADISKANVHGMFLLTENLEQADAEIPRAPARARASSSTASASPAGRPTRPKRPTATAAAGAPRICSIVPAKVAGTWQLPEGEFVLEQKFQTFTGTLSNGKNRTPIANGRLDGNRISFTVGQTSYVGQVDGNTMRGDVKGSTAGTWTATRK